MWASKWGEPVLRTLLTYSNPQHAAQAIERIIANAEEQAIARARAELAAGVCDGLHDGPPSGTKCLACYEAEHHLTSLAAVEAEIEQAKAQMELNPKGQTERIYDVEPLEE